MIIKSLSKEEFSEALDDRIPKGRLSQGAINKYLSCPQDYYRTYVLEQPFAANEKMILGSATHKLIENCINLKVSDKANRTPSLEEILDDSRGITEELYFNEAGEEPEGVELGMEGVVDAAQKSFITWYKNRMPVISPICAEKEIRVTINDIPIIGYIDYIDATPLGPSVRDIKVSKKKRNPEDSLQLGIYALAEGTPNVGFDTILQPTKRLDTRLEISDAILPESYLQHVGSIVTQVYRGITQGFFPPCLPDHWLCQAKWCSHYANCRGKDIST